MIRGYLIRLKLLLLYFLKKEDSYDELKVKFYLEQAFSGDASNRIRYENQFYDLMNSYKETKSEDKYNRLLEIFKDYIGHMSHRFSINVDRVGEKLVKLKKAKEELGMDQEVQLPSKLSNFLNKDL